MLISGSMSGSLSIRIVAAVLAFTLSTVRALADEETATVKLERASAFSGDTVWTDTVYVNGDRVGTIGSGDKESFSFTPAKDGSNTIRIESADSRQSSHTTTFEAFPGAVIRGYVAECKATTSVEKAGIKPSVPVETSLDKDVIEREVSSELVKTLKGTKRIIKRSRSIEHVVSVTDSRSVEGIAGVDISVVRTQVRAQIEQQLSQSFKTTELLEQSIEIDGKDLPQLRLVWVERFRKGSATITVNGVNRKIAFEFPIDLELRPEAVENTVNDAPSTKPSTKGQ